MADAIPVFPEGVMAERLAFDYALLKFANQYPGAIRIDDILP